MPGPSSFFAHHPTQDPHATQGGLEDVLFLLSGALTAPTRGTLDSKEFQELRRAIRENNDTQAKKFYDALQDIQITGEAKKLLEDVLSRGARVTCISYNSTKYVEFLLTQCGLKRYLDNGLLQVKKASQKKNKHDIAAQVMDEALNSQTPPQYVVAVAGGIGAQETLRLTVEALKSKDVDSSHLVSHWARRGQSWPAIVMQKLTQVMTQTRTALRGLHGGSSV